jgi:hypothetical protein
MVDVLTAGALADEPLCRLITVTDGIVHYLTRWCGASAKGPSRS